MALGYETTGTGPNIIANAGNAMAADIRRIGEVIRKDIQQHNQDKQVVGFLQEAKMLSPEAPDFQNQLVGVFAKYPAAAGDQRALTGAKFLHDAWEQKQLKDKLTMQLDNRVTLEGMRRPPQPMYGDEPGGLRQPRSGGLLGGDGAAPGALQAEPAGPNEMFNAGGRIMGALGGEANTPLGVPFTPPVGSPTGDLIEGMPPERILKPKYQKALDLYQNEIKGSVKREKGAADVARYRADLYKQQLAEESTLDKADDFKPVPTTGRLYNPKTGNVKDLGLPEKGMTPYQKETLDIRKKEFEQKVSRANATEKRALLKDRITELKDERKVFLDGYKENVDAANRLENDTEKKPLLDVATKQFEAWQKKTDEILKIQKDHDVGDADDVSPKDKEALDWAKKNPSDPRAIRILEKLGGV